MRLKSPTNNKYYQKGAILLISLFMMAMMEVVVIFVLMKYRHTFFGSINFISSFQAVSLTRGIEDQLINKLIADKRDKIPSNSISFPRVNIDDGYVEAELIDLQGKFNLNNLVDQTTVPFFVTTLTTLLSEKGNIATPLIQFIQDRVQYYSQAGQVQNSISSLQSQQNSIPGNMQTGLDQKSQQVAQQQGPQPTPGKAPRQLTLLQAYPFTSLSELLVKPELDKKTYHLLENFLTVLPEVTTLNVNTASEFALMTLSPKITLPIAKNIIKFREQSGGFKTTDDFVMQLTAQNVKLDNVSVTVDSNYFLSSIYIKYRNASMNVFTLLKVEANENDISVKVLWRSLNTV